MSLFFVQTDGKNSAWNFLENRNGKFRLKFRFEGRQYSRSLKTSKEHVSLPNRHETQLGTTSRVGEANYIKPSRPNPTRPPNAVPPIFRTIQPGRIRALDEIAKLAGERPQNWIKPKYGDFEYWLAHNCGWISPDELKKDAEAHNQKRELALHTSRRFRIDRFKWEEGARHEEPANTGEYCPQVNMKLVKDRNLTDSTRRIAMFVLRHVYQDNRKGRFIGMTVSFISKGLSISRQTVQRSLTLLETRGYFNCEVAKGKESRMCIGLIIQLLGPLFPKHHKEKWPKKRKNSGASQLPLKQIQFHKRIYETPEKASRFLWAMRCMAGIDRALSKSGAIGMENSALNLRYVGLSILDT